MARRISNLKARRLFKRRLVFGLTQFKPLRLFCDYCDKYIPSDMGWCCSHCDNDNVWTNVYSFLNKCQKCKRSPKSYKCPHCGEINFLDTDEDSAHPACRSVTAAALVADPDDEELEQHERQKQRLRWEIELTELNARLAQLKASPEFQQEVSTKEKLEKSFSEHDAHVMGVHIIAKEERTKAAVTYKDDPDLLQDKNDSIAQWEESQAL